MCSRGTSRNNRWMTYGHAFESPNCSEPEPIAPLSQMLTLLPSAKTRSSNLEGNLLLAPASTVCISSAQHVETQKAAERVPSVRLCHMRRWQSPTSHRPCRRRLKALLRLYAEAGHAAGHAGQARGEAPWRPLLRSAAERIPTCRILVTSCELFCGAPLPACSFACIQDAVEAQNVESKASKGGL